METTSLYQSGRSHTPLVCPWTPLKAVIKAVPLYEGDYDTSDNPLVPTAAKTEGTALGAFYQFESDQGPQSPTLLGKVGEPSGLLRDDAESVRSRTRWQINVDTMREKAAADMFQGLSYGRYQTPVTCLSRQPVMDKFTLGHELARHWASQNISDTLRVMSQMIEGYRDFTHARTQLDRDSISFIDFIEQSHRPPETLCTPKGNVVPLLGMMEMCAAFRLLSDTDALGGNGHNAGFVWEKDADGEIIAARAVKIDPGYAFQFAETNIIAKKATGTGNQKHTAFDLRNIQVANTNLEITLLWEVLTNNQQEQFIDALTLMINELSHPEILPFCFFRKGKFTRNKSEELPEKTAQELC
jgi:hypothetical protein